jgi:hypothetical protein
MKQTIFLLTILPLFALGQNVSFQTITLESYLSLQNYEHFKRLVFNSNDSQAEYIEDFDFEWRYKYQLKVKVTELIPELSDGNKYELVLDQIISKTKISNSTEFKFFIDPLIYYHNSTPEDGGISHSLKSLNDSTYLYFDQVEIEIPAILKNQFQKIASGKTGKGDKFIFLNKKGIRLISL